MVFLETVNELLEHIKTVEQDTIELTRKSQMQLAAFIQTSGKELDDATIEAMQYQDIISQQLSATIEAIEDVQSSIKHFNHAFSHDEAVAVESIDKMHSKLNTALAEAQAKRSAFAGKTSGDTSDDGIEFF